MRAPLLFLPAIVVLAATLISCGASEEEAPGNAANPTATQAPATSRVPSPTSSPSPATVPADWLTYSHRDGLFTVAYPPTWFERDGTLYSDNPETWDKPSQPSDVVAIHIGYYEAAGSSGCVALTVDPKSGEGSPVEGATPAILAGLPAWQIVREPGDPLLNDPMTRIQGISMIYKGYCFSVTAYFTQEKPDVEAFLRIAGSFQFKF